MPRNADEGNMRLYELVYDLSVNLVPFGASEICFGRLLRGPSTYLMRQSVGLGGRHLNNLDSADGGQDSTGVWRLLSDNLTGTVTVDFHFLILISYKGSLLNLAGNIFLKMAAVQSYF
jgi:hypothetical protein